MAGRLCPECLHFYRSDEDHQCVDDRPTTAVEGESVPSAINDLLLKTFKAVRPEDLAKDPNALAGVINAAANYKRAEKEGGGGGDGMVEELREWLQNEPEVPPVVVRTAPLPAPPVDDDVGEAAGGVEPDRHAPEPDPEPPSLVDKLRGARRNRPPGSRP